MQIAQAILDLLDEEISLEELQEDDNATAFFHAVSNLAPMLVAKRLGMIDEDASVMDLNHLANTLIYQNKPNS